MERYCFAVSTSEELDEAPLNLGEVGADEDALVAHALEDQLHVLDVIDATVLPFLQNNLYARLMLSNNLVGVDLTCEGFADLINGIFGLLKLHHGSLQLLGVDRS